MLLRLGCLYSVHVGPLFGLFRTGAYASTPFKNPESASVSQLLWVLSFGGLEVTVGGSGHEVS